MQEKKANKSNNQVGRKTVRVLVFAYFHWDALTALGR